MQPQLLLQKYVHQSSALAAAFKEALRDHPNTYNSPWSMVVYFDELTPGNVLRPDNRRKIMAVYMGFKELGAHIICKTEAWFTIAVVRMTQVREVVGGWSHMLRVLLRRVFLDQPSFSSAGVLLQFDQPHLFFATLTNIIADEAALKLALDSKGAPSAKMSC